MAKKNNYVKMNVIKEITAVFPLKSYLWLTDTGL